MDEKDSIVPVLVGALKNQQPDIAGSADVHEGAMPQLNVAKSYLCSMRAGSFGALWQSELCRALPAAWTARFTQSVRCQVPKRRIRSRNC